MKTPSPKTAAAPIGLVGSRLLWPLTAVRIAGAGRAQWRANLTRRQRRRLLALLVASRGRPRKHLSRRERRQLRALVHAYRPLQFARTATITALPIPGSKALRR